MSVTAASGQEKPVRVLYVAGGARSGSTILGMVLGEIPGFFFAGELIDYWRLWSSRDHRCSCGELLHACSIWSRVSRAGVEGLDQDSARNMVAWRDQYARSHGLLWHRLKGKSYDPRSGEGPQTYAERLKSLYLAIQRQTGCDLLVDTSKNAGYAEFLAAMPEVQLNVVHLVRDPRASAFSWQRRRRPDALETERLLPRTIQWDSRNLGAELLRYDSSTRYLRLHYEDFAAEPRVTTSEILEFLGEDDRGLPFDAQDRVSLDINHGVYGNPVRRQQGPVALKVDDEWTGMPRRHRLAVTALTLPLLLRYGYPLAARTRVRRDD